MSILNHNLKYTEFLFTTLWLESTLGMFRSLDTDGGLSCGARLGTLTLFTLITSGGEFPRVTGSAWLIVLRVLFPFDLLCKNYIHC